MPDLRNLKQLLDAAFQSQPARDANAAIAAVREEHEQRVGGPAWNYEVLLPPVGEVTYLLDEMLPRLTYFLHNRGTPLGPDVFLSIFAGDTLYFLTVPDTLAVLSEWSGLSVEDMQRRWSDGFGAAPLMLPGPQK